MYQATKIAEKRGVSFLCLLERAYRRYSILVIGASAQNSVLPVVRVSSIQTTQSSQTVQSFIPHIKAAVRLLVFLFQYAIYCICEKGSSYKKRQNRKNKQVVISSGRL